MRVEGLGFRIEGVPALRAFEASGALGALRAPTAEGFLLFRGFGFRVSGLGFRV